MSSRRKSKSAPPLRPDPENFSMQEFREYVSRVRDIRPGDLAGCTPGEIEHLMRVQQVGRVPRMYRDFLLDMGKNPAPMMPSVDWTYRDLLQIKGEILGDIVEAGEVDPGFLDDALVIGLADGHLIFYIPEVGTAPDDPPVWKSSDGHDPEQIQPSFRRFLLSTAEDDGSVVRI